MRYSILILILFFACSSPVEQTEVSYEDILTRDGYWEVDTIFSGNVQMHLTSQFYFYKDSTLYQTAKFFNITHNYEIGEGAELWCKWYLYSENENTYINILPDGYPEDKDSNSKILSLDNKKLLLLSGDTYITMKFYR